MPWIYEGRGGGGTGKTTETKPIAYLFTLFQFVFVLQPNSCLYNSELEAALADKYAPFCKSEIIAHHSQFVSILKLKLLLNQFYLPTY